MLYMLTGIDDHLDFGFGITGEAYHDAADFLFDNRSKLNTPQQVEMPINYLYRHSIELFLKSLIIIFHERLQIPYENEHCNNSSPIIKIKGKHKSLFDCHWIDELYDYWINDLLLKYKEILKTVAPKGDWYEDSEITKLFKLISKYDRDSSYFRYPITKNHKLDSKKYTMQPLNMERFQNRVNSKNSKSKQSKGGGIVMLFTNSENEIVRGYEQTDNVLEEVTQALKKVSYTFSAIHVMTRVTLCNGK
jgi:hypothetical protein